MRRVIFCLFVAALVCGPSVPGWADLTTVNGTPYPMRFPGLEVSAGNGGGLFRLDFQDPAGTNVDAWGLNQDAYTPPETGTPETTVRALGYDASALWGVDAVAADGESGDGGFLSLCLEQTEGVPTMWGTLNSTTTTLPDNTELLTTNAVQGSVSTPGGDPICRATAWLYLQFATGQTQFGSGASAASYTGSVADVKLLQETLWWLEGEPYQSQPTDAKYLAAASGALGVSIANLPADLYQPTLDRDTEPFTVVTLWGPNPEDVRYTDKYEVYVVNCTNNGDKQDYPVVITNRTFGIVPEPASVLIWGISLCLFGLGIRRR